MQLRQPLQAEPALLGGSDGGQRLLLEREVRLEFVTRDHAAALDGDHRSERQLTLLELDPGIALGELERDRVEAKKSSLRRVPIQRGRPIPRASKSSERPSSSQAAAIEPLSCWRACAVRPRERSASAKMISESTVIPGSARLMPWCGEEIVVVSDDAVVDPDHRAVADGMVVGGQARVPFGVVADVDRSFVASSGSSIRSSSALAPDRCLCTVTVEPGIR